MGFVFPSSPTDKTPFLDGDRVLPEYLATLMARFDTSELTYDQAVALVNQSMVARHVGTSSDQLISNHFRGLNRGDR